MTTLPGQLIDRVILAADDTGASAGRAANGVAYDAPIAGVTAITAPGRGFIINTTAAGNVTITWADGSGTMTMAVALGHSYFPYSVSNVVAAASSPATIASVYGAK